VSAALDAFFARVRAGDTGALAWADGPRRRAAWLDNGELVLIHSNLKSESPARVEERNPGASPSELRRALARARLAGLFYEKEGAVEWLDREEPPRREPEDLPLLLGLMNLPAVPAGAFPRASAGGDDWIARLACTPAIKEYLRSLDGSRDAEDVLQFGPAPPDDIDGAIRAAWLLGAIVDSGGQAVTYVVRTGGGASPAGRDPAAVLPAVEVRQPTQPALARLGETAKKVQAARTHFEVLGTRAEDDVETHRRAYFALARDLHPDQYATTSPEARARASVVFDRVRAAWELLADDKQRKDYVAQLRGQKTEDELAAEKVRGVITGEASFKRGMLEFRAGRVAAAHEHFAVATAAVPEEREFQAYAGYCAFRVFEKRDADRAAAGVNSIRAAIAANERLDAAHYLLGLVHRAQGNADAARASFTAALKIRPANIDAERELRRLDRERDAKKEAGSAGLLGRFFSASKPPPATEAGSKAGGPKKGTGKAGPAEGK
jgi:curved DNA-binding protein CbpA